MAKGKIVSRIIALLAAAIALASAAEARVIDTKWNLDYCNTTKNIIASVQIVHWDDLNSELALGDLLSKIRSDGLSRCSSTVGIDLNIWQSGFQRNMVEIRWNRQSNRWIVQSALSERIEREATATVARVGDESKRQAAEQREKQKKAALADCGPSPMISGGPWFSSTYKTGALDQVARITPPGSAGSMGHRLLCVKVVEYIGPAVNPMGGNAARARFIGHEYNVERNYPAVSVVIDFPY